MNAKQLEFSFSTILYDKDGDKWEIEPQTNYKTIQFFTGCIKKKALETIANLQKNYDVYTIGHKQIILAQGEKIVYNFEIGGQTTYQGHKWNALGPWDFRHLIENKKVGKKKPTKIKPIKLTVTEMQLKRAQQLYYALSIGFDITYKDYQRFYLMM